MLSWILANWSTIVVGLILLLLIAAVGVSLFKGKKQGKTGCSGNCAGCPGCRH